MTSTRYKKLHVTKASGKQMIFLPGKLKHSLKRSGADEATSKQIVDDILIDAYDGISTQEIYKKAFRLLRQKSRQQAARYKLKHAIMELGPTGYPFEIFIGKIFEQLQYKVKIGQIIKGECVQHEVDVIAVKDNRLAFAECKFHNRPGIKCDIKIPLYVHSRYRDIENHYQKQPKTNGKIHEGWVVTNTHFTEDAIQYGGCTGLQLLGWDYPQGNGLKDMIDRMGLHPVTCITTLRNTEKQFLMDKKIVLSNQLLKESNLLKTLRIDDNRSKQIMTEIEGLCTPMIKAT
jgi:hypothetical protein